MKDPSFDGKLAHWIENTSREALDKPEVKSHLSIKGLLVTLGRILELIKEEKGKGRLDSVAEAIIDTYLNELHAILLLANPTQRDVDAIVCAHCSF